MSLLIHNPKFLLDENVRVELFRLIKDLGGDVKFVPKSVSDKQVALISKREKRVLVTCDEDFVNLSQDEIFAVIWLRIPQNEPATLTKSFGKLLEEVHEFSRKLVILSPQKWDIFQLGDDISAQKRH